MSRSFKKVPIIKVPYFGKHGKHIANKKVRRIDISNYGNYKKVYERYNIYDQICSLFMYNNIDSIPSVYGYWKLTYNEIMEYWRK